MQALATRRERYACRPRALGRALALGEPEGYVRVFPDEGLPMAALLQDAATGGSPRAMFAAS